MRVRVLYFGVLKDVFGRSGEDVELVEGASVADLVATFRGKGAGAGGVWDAMAVGVNQEYARGVDVLKDGDEVALLPPVSGGWEDQKANTGILHCVQDDDSSRGQFVKHGRGETG